MAYKKFDDPDEKVSQAGARGNEATQLLAMRRAIQAISNRVVGFTTGGTSGSGYLTQANLGTGGTSGVKINNAVVVTINGVNSTCISQDNLYMPNYGTFGTRKVAKFLVSTGAGTSGTVTGPGNVVDADDYADDTTALAACKLPDLPDGHCALGWVGIVFPRATEVVMSSKALIGLESTAGTATWQNLTCMPYDA
jgi:hypothetical protein